MKILYCTGQLANKGGMEKVLANKTNHFVNLPDYEIAIITQSQKQYPYAYEFDKKIEFYDIDISQLNKKVIKGYTFIKNIFRLRKIYTELIHTINPDVIIVTERGYLDFVIPYIVPEIPKLREFHFAKEAVYVHAKLMPFWQRLRHLFVYQFIFKSFNRYDYMVLLTNRDKERGKYKTNTVVIPNMLQDNLPKESASLTNKKVISVGSMHDSRKNFELQIELWKEIITIQPEWQLHIYGDGAKRKTLIQLVEKLGLTNNVFLHGTSNTMEKHYLDASIFLFTSKAEGLPMVLLEAQSYGLPIVSFDTPTGPSDIIENNQTGFVVDYNNTKALKEKLLLLMENEKLRKNMGKNAKLNASKYTPDNVIKLWTDLFNSLKNDK